MKQKPVFLVLENDLTVDPVDLQLIGSFIQKRVSSEFVLNPLCGLNRLPKSQIVEEIMKHEYVITTSVFSGGSDTQFKELVEFNGRTGLFNGKTLFALYLVSFLDVTWNGVTPDFVKGYNSLNVFGGTQAKRVILDNCVLKVTDEVFTLN